MPVVDTTRPAGCRRTGRGLATNLPLPPRDIAMSKTVALLTPTAAATGHGHCPVPPLSHCGTCPILLIRRLLVWTSPLPAIEPGGLYLAGSLRTLLADARLQPGRPSATTSDCRSPSKRSSDRNGTEQAPPGLPLAMRTGRVDYPEQER